MRELRVGVVGYCPPTKFDEAEAHRMIVEAYEKIATDNPDRSIVVVSGLTDVGVLGIAYKEATMRDWKTIGIACSKAMDHPLFPVDEKIIVGEKWGEESETFLSSIDMIVRIGIGKQSLYETERTKQAGKPTIEYNLPAIIPSP